MKYVWRGGKWLPIDPHYVPKPRIHIISDCHAPFRSMADGKMYDSKSRYRAELKARGYQELGNDTDVSKRPEMPSAVPDLERAYSKLS